MKEINIIFMKQTSSETHLTTWGISHWLLLIFFVYFPVLPETKKGRIHFHLFEKHTKGMGGDIGCHGVDAQAPLGAEVWGNTSWWYGGLFVCCLKAWSRRCYLWKKSGAEMWFGIQVQVCYTYVHSNVCFFVYMQSISIYVSEYLFCFYTQCIPYLCAS